MTEPTGERFQTSPELGFAFGRIPLGTVLDCLTSPELRDNQEANEVAEGLEGLRYYIEEGGDQSFLEAYTSAIKEALRVKENRAFPTEVYEKYQEISEILYAAHRQRVDEEKTAINDFLNQFPGVVTQDTEGRMRLVSVESSEIFPIEIYSTFIKMSVRQFALWSDQTQTELNGPIPLFVDMTVLPETFSRYLNQYRTLYEIELGD